MVIGIRHLIGEEEESLSLWVPWLQKQVSDKPSYSNMSSQLFFEENLTWEVFVMLERSGEGVNWSCLQRARNVCSRECHAAHSRFKTLKPKPNGVASGHKLKTWVNLQLHLARPCLLLRWLAMTCAHFGRDQICTQAKASFPPFDHLTQVNASWVKSINLLLANKIEDSLS